ncbi:MAG: hypothetical protein QXF17_06670 [Ignisphaera sp.]
MYTADGRTKTRDITEEDIKNAEIKVYYREPGKQSTDDSSSSSNSEYITLPYEIAKDIYHTYVDIILASLKDYAKKNDKTICPAQVYEVILWVEVQKDTINEFSNDTRDVIDKAITMYFNYKINAIVHKSRYSNSRIGQSASGYILFRLYNKLYPVEVNVKADDILEQILAYMLIRQ